MNNIYAFFDKWNIGKIVFWYRIFAYTFFISQSFKINNVFNYYSSYSDSASAVQVTQLATQGLLEVCNHLASIIFVGIVLIALEIQWSGKRNKINDSKKGEHLE